MPWDNSNRAERLPRDWTARRARVLRRDGYRCTWPASSGAACGMPANQVDHVVPSARGGSHDESNLRALCVDHHQRKTNAEAADGRAAARAAGRFPAQRSSRRDPEAHPGAYLPPPR